MNNSIVYLGGCPRSLHPEERSFCSCLCTATASTEVMEWFTRALRLQLFEPGAELETVMRWDKAERVEVIPGEVN